MISQALKNLSTIVVNPNIEWENEFIPCSGVSDLDRERHFTNINQDLLRKVRQVKAQ